MLMGNAISRNSGSMLQAPRGAIAILPPDPFDSGSQKRAARAQDDNLGMRRRAHNLSRRGNLKRSFIAYKWPYDIYA
jgi:hypothetical protein